MFADSESVNLAVARDGFLLQWKLSAFFIATLITEVLFKQFLICTAV